jgi:hypothetical protein
LSEPPTLRPTRPLPPLRWFGGDEPALPMTCSACGAAIPERSAPLMLFRSDGSALARFCRACQRDYWGIENFEKDEENR